MARRKKPAPPSFGAEVPLGDLVARLAVAALVTRVGRPHEVPAMQRQADALTAALNSVPCRFDLTATDDAGAELLQRVEAGDLGVLDAIVRASRAGHGLTVTPTKVSP
jgi:hypothetical protein